ncbi:glycosyltransferase [Brevundimonas sp. NIBR11]|uniref:glycosyltransferase n=1 Tax=Brevundimonas sp. NIBR11 TaxID=3015999 RepID=UPI0022F12EE6|nr:glycosyltransferase [Brevundimonas sp. NIBR11]WGM31825.1 D-inositol-3-phosphate glycosyltransferase [Brevundimonas sp. NIBR11]
MTLISGGLMPDYGDHSVTDGSVGRPRPQALAGQRKRILVIGKYYPPFQGGIEHVTQLYVDRLSQTHDVRTMVNAHDRTSGEERLGRARLTRLRTWFSAFSQPIAPSLMWKLRLSDYDMVQFHAPNPFAGLVLWLHLACSRFRGVLVIVHHMEIHGRGLIRACVQPIYLALVRRAAWVAVSSRKNFALSRDLPADAPIVTLPFCVRADEYSISASTRAETLAWRRARYGKAPLVGFVGRHARYKGLDVLVRALAEMPNVRAVIAGDGPTRAETMTLANALGVADRIDFPGALNHADKLRLLSAIDVFAFPSTENTEAFGVSQLEAMQVGAVVVASDLPTGVTDISIDEETALVARPGDPEDLARQLTRVLTDRDLANRLRTNAAAHVERTFSEPAVLTELDRLTRVALQSPTGQPQARVR